MYHFWALQNVNTISMIWHFLFNSLFYYIMPNHKYAFYFFAMLKIDTKIANTCPNSMKKHSHILILQFWLYDDFSNFNFLGIFKNAELPKKYIFKTWSFLLFSVVKKIIMTLVQNPSLRFFLQMIEINKTSNEFPGSRIYFRV